MVRWTSHDRQGGRARSRQSGLAGRRAAGSPERAPPLDDVPRAPDEIAPTACSSRLDAPISPTACARRPAAAPASSSTSTHRPARACCRRSPPRSARLRAEGMLPRLSCPRPAQRRVRDRRIVEYMAPGPRHARLWLSATDRPGCGPDGVIRERWSHSWLPNLSQHTDWGLANRMTKRRAGAEGDRGASRSERARNIRAEHAPVLGRVQSVARPIPVMHERQQVQRGA